MLTQHPQHVLQIIKQAGELYFLGSLRTDERNTIHVFLPNNTDSINWVGENFFFKDFYFIGIIQAWKKKPFIRVDFETKENAFDQSRMSQERRVLRWKNVFGTSGQFNLRCYKFSRFFPLDPLKSLVQWICKENNAQAWHHQMQIVTAEWVGRLACNSSTFSKHWGEKRINLTAFKKSEQP